VSVNSLDETLARIRDLGGVVVQERMEVPGQGWFGVFTDPEGNTLAVWESSAAAG
jgi:hypothetical protein